MIRYSGKRNIHFIGIGGAGMSGIAEVLFNMGQMVSGSDISDNANVKQLKSRGIRVYLGHSPQNIRNADTVVYSSAIRADNLELREARKRRIPVIPRAEMLAELMRLKYSIAVAGTHGKTTTTSMIATILTVIGMDPTYVVGGKLKTGESGAKLGNSDYLVAEADESDGSFLSLLSTVAVITNIENDHLDHYRNMDHLKDAFCQFVNSVPFYGCGVINGDCTNSLSLVPKINRRVISFGRGKENEVRAVGIRDDMLGSSFELVHGKKNMGTISLNIGGEHNVSNALAACATCLYLGVGVEDIQRGLGGFYPPSRRFQVLFYDRDTMVVDDYAHHPTEIRVTLDLIRKGPYERVITVFQPHRYTRVQQLRMDFIQAFSRTDLLIITPIYSANQEPIENISGERLAGEIGEQQGGGVKYLEDFNTIRDYLMGIRKKGDAFLFLSAGNLSQAAHDFAKSLKEKQQ